MAGKTVIKPYKLQPTGDTLSRDDLSTWVQIILGHCRQNPGWLQFLPTSVTFNKWLRTDEDATNGLIGADADATNTLRANFQDFLTCIATYAPAGLNDTIVRESTSFNWVIDLIKTTFGLETKGENFLTLDEMKFDFEVTTYHQALMELKDFVCSGLIKKGDIFEGKPAAANEILSPTTKNFLMKTLLAKVDTRLPKHVRDTRGHLFTLERPTLACNQKILIDQIPTMLAELDKKDAASQGNVNVGYVLAQDNINVGYVPAHRGRGGVTAPRGSYLGRVPFRGGPSRYHPPARGQFQQAGRGQPQPGGCVRCLEATPPRYDAAKCHAVKDCPWPRQPPHQQANRQPNFRVVMFPDPQMGAQMQPQVATVGLGQQAPTYSYPGMEVYNHDYTYDQYYLPQEEYMGASISELPQQDL